MNPDASIQALQACFEDGVLVRPEPRTRPDLVHLIRAIATLCGIQGLDQYAPTRQLIDLIQPHDHLIFVLLDGLGVNIASTLPATSILASHLRAQIRSTCPSTTASALTSIATADWPAAHAVTGWFTRLPIYGRTAMILPFADRFTSRPLPLLGIVADDVFTLPPILPRMKRSALTVSPAYLANTVYNNWCRGSTPVAGYSRIREAMEQAQAHVLSSTQPTYTYIYIPDVDTLCHHVGVSHDAVLPLVLSIDAELERLATALAGRARIIITADHGLIDIPTPNQTLLHAGDPLLEFLEAPPTGDARMPIFHLRPGRHDEFAAYFRNRFGEHFVLLETAQAQEMELFGPGALSEMARRRFGDFVAIPFGPTTLSYHPPEKPVGHLYLAVHAGLSPQEMLVPLYVI